MEHFLEKLKKIGGGIFLSSSRKAEIRDRLVRLIEAEAGMGPARHRSEASFWLVLLRPMPALAAVLLVIALGGGTTFAAQAALPGESLYPVKLLSEGVQGALIVNEEAKIEWETALAERRLEEAARLASAGRLNEELEEQLRARFAAHAKKVKARIAKMESRENFFIAAGLAGRFEASLDAHSRILARIDADNSESNRPSAGLALKSQVAVERDEVENVRSAAEANAEAEVSRSSAPESSRAAENKAATAARLLAQADAFRELKDAAPALRFRTAPPEESATGLADPGGMMMSLAVPLEEVPAGLTEGESAFESALALLAEARAKLKAGDYAEAFRLGNEAVRLAQEAKVLLRAEKELQIKVDARLDGGQSRRGNASLDESERNEIRSYEECIAAGNPMMKSLPPKCAADGRVFVEGVSGFDLNIER